MNIEEITISQEGIDWQNCLPHWSWLLKINPEFNILLVTKFGEVFVTCDNGSVWFLSTSSCSYEKIDNSIDKFADSMNDIDNLNYYFMPNVIALLESELGTLKKDQCYGFKIPCVFKECTFEANNFKITNLERYLIGLGDMLGKLQSSPDGEKVSFNVVV